MFEMLIINIIEFLYHLIKETEYLNSNDRYQSYVYEIEIHMNLNCWKLFSTIILTTYEVGRIFICGHLCNHYLMFCCTKQFQ